MYMYENKKQTTTDRKKAGASKTSSQLCTSVSNVTGIPDDMKVRFENLSGFSFDDVRVHYNSDKPAQFQALAYTQGSQVYIGQGQEHHMEHELAHVVQQKQGRVTPTAYFGNIAINDEPGLEQEAERYYKRADTLEHAPDTMGTTSSTVQRVIIVGDDADMESESAYYGYNQLISPAEIDNTNDYLTKDESHGKQKVYNINSLINSHINGLGQIKFDDINYLNGHHEAIGKESKYLGLTAKELAKELIKHDIQTQNRLILTGCDTQKYAEALAAALKELKDQNISVVGAEGIAFDYEDEDEGAVHEALFNDSLIKGEIIKKVRGEMKLEIVTKYESKFLNDIIKWVNSTYKSNEDAKKYFLEKLKRVTNLEKKGQDPENIDEETREKIADVIKLIDDVLKAGEDKVPVSVTSEQYKKMAAVSYKLVETYPKVEEMFGKLCDKKDGEDKEYKIKRFDLTRYKNHLPKQKKFVKVKIEKLQDLENGDFAIKEYKDKNKQFLKSFMEAINGEDSIDTKQRGIIEYIKKSYKLHGKAAANEYVRNLVNKYKEENSCIDKDKSPLIKEGWHLFCGEEKINAFATYRDAAKWKNE